MSQKLTAQDFIRGNLQNRRMRFGWSISVTASHMLNLSYGLQNFDWKSTEALTGEEWNRFLLSDAYLRMKKRMEYARLKVKRLFYEACSISELKMLVEEYGLKVDIDKMISKKIRKNSEALSKNV